MDTISSTWTAAGRGDLDQAPEQCVCPVSKDVSCPHLPCFNPSKAPVNEGELSPHALLVIVRQNALGNHHSAAASVAGLVFRGWFLCFCWAQRNVVGPRVRGNGLFNRGQFTATRKEPRAALTSSSAGAGAVKTGGLQAASISTEVVCLADCQSVLLSVFARTCGGFYKAQKRAVGDEN